MPIDVGKFPYNTVEIMFTDPVWTDVTTWFRGASIRRGSSRVDSPILRYEAGTASVRLDNRDRRFDPTNLAGPYVENFSADSTEQTFIAGARFFYGHGLSLCVKSAAGQTAAIVNVTAKASGTTASYTCQKPAGTVSGMRMIAMATCDNGTPANLTISGGSAWIPLGTFTSGDHTCQTRVWYKTAGGSEPTSYTIGQAAGADGVCAIATISGADSVSAPAYLFADNPQATLFRAPGVVPFAANDLDIRWCAGTFPEAFGVTWQSPVSEGFTEYADKQSQNFTGGVFAARPLTGSIGTGTDTKVIPGRPIRLRSQWSFDPTTNLVQNPSFEVDTVGWTTTGQGVIASTDALSYSGGRSLRVSRGVTSPPLFVYGATATGVAGGTSAGQTVSISAYVYVPASSFPKITGYLISAVGVAGTFVSGPPAADGWYRIQLTSVLSAELDDIQIQFWTDDTHGDGQVVGYIDAVQAEVKSSPTDYCDGSSPGCSWSGTANNSSSVRPSSYTFNLFTGYIDDWLIDWEQTYDSEVTLPCTDGFALLSGIERQALGSDVGTGELTGARINRILDSAGWTAGRIIAAGNSTVQGTTLSGDALTELFLVADTEIGEFYIDGSGNAVFRNRQAILTDTRSIENQAKFGDGGDTAGELTYDDVGITYESTQLINQVRIARTGGVQQTAEDTESQLKYKRVNTFERTDLLMQSDGEAYAYASWVLFISKDAELRFDVLTIQPQKDDDRLFPQVLSREIGDRILIRRRPVGGGEVIEREVFVRGIEHEIGQWTWVTKYNLQSSGKVGNFLTLNHPELGKIGQNALVY